MKYKSAFHKIINLDKGTFTGTDFQISHDSVNWIYSHKLTITSDGELYLIDEGDGEFLLLQLLQSCYVQIYPSFGPSQAQATKSLKTKRSLSTLNDRRLSNLAQSGTSTPELPPAIFIRTCNNEKLYIQISSKQNFGNLISCLIVWQSLKPPGLAKKWYSENKVKNSLVANEPHELLVCRFKIYGPLPSKLKNLHVVPGPKAPVYVPKDTKPQSNVDASQTLATSEINEGWFYTMGVLKSNGILNFISELDGTLIYSVDVKSLLSSEIREIHHSVFDSSNVLMIGFLKELRFNNVIKTTSNLTLDDYACPNFLVRENKPIPNNQRLLIEFPLHIDLEDWFVGLNYFAKREYIGAFSPNSKILEQQQATNSGIKNTTTQNSMLSRTNSSDTSTNEKLPKLEDFCKDSFRVSKKLTIDIIEAKFDNYQQPMNGKIYAEVRMWGLPWSRTAIVDLTSNPFWKEEFKTDLPISTQMIHILIKKCLFSDSNYSAGDKVIGTVYVTPDILTKELNSSSTIMSGYGGGNNIHYNTLDINENQNATNLGTPRIPASNSGLIKFNNDIVRLSIYDSGNIQIGKLLLNVRLEEYHILAPRYFKPLERMLVNAPMKDLVNHCNETVPSSEFENVSIIMLDIFQSLGVEEKWFKALLERELLNVDKLTRKNYVSNRLSSDNIAGAAQGSNTGSGSSSNNVFNTLFRGSSMFSKSLEQYNLRVGQEYLEKVFGNFFTKIATEKKNCEVDPRYVRLQEKAERKGKTVEEVLDDTDSDSDTSDFELDQREYKIKRKVLENFDNLNNYAEEVWKKIYETSNDLPEQIKTQLKNFRTKVELACDPDDKTTSLNCLSAFIFLRFFCPAILNPKLFYLTKEHQTGNTQRTLTLIAKILLNLGNRQQFSPHKEPHLVKMNKFLEKHQPEVYEYFDRITGRKNDFNEKVLNLSHEVKRLDLGLSSDLTSNELPTTPYLIDKYLRLTELIHLLNPSKENGLTGITTGSPSKYTSPSPNKSPGNLTSTSSMNTINDGRNSHQELSRVSTENGQMNRSKNVYQIGSLEFEKSEFLDLAGDIETEGFIKSLCSNENIFSFIASNITFKDLQEQASVLMNKITDLEIFLENPEVPANYLGQTPSNSAYANKQNDTSGQLWNSFTNDILSKCCVDLDRNCLVYTDDNTNTNCRKLVEQNALNLLKLKFTPPSNTINGKTQYSNSSISSSFSSGSLQSIIKSGSKNPLKKWFRKPS